MSSGCGRAALSTGDYDLSEDILDALAARAGEDFSPSQIARLPGVLGDTRDVHRVLPALVADGNLTTTDQGARSRYRFAFGFWQS